MTKLHALALSLTTIVLIAASSISLNAQAASAARQPASIAVSIALEKDHVPVGKSPWLILTVKNLTGQDVAIHGPMVRIHVEGEKGERPTTQAQRTITGKLRPGEASLRTDEYVLWSIAPAASSSHKYELSYFYDLSAPGKHTVYVEVMDPLSEKWLRTNTAMFEIEAPTQ
jgi:hypothetical protein